MNCVGTSSPLAVVQFLTTEVSNDTGGNTGKAFLLELYSWLNLRCLTMGKNRAPKDPEGAGDVSPAKASKIAEPQVAGTSAVTTPAQPQPQQQAGMLHALNDISLILKEGFKSLRTEVGDVSTGIKNLEGKMNDKFEALVETYDSGDESMAESVAGVDAVMDRQGDHALSDGEIVENQSPVLSATLKELALDESIGDPVKENVASFVKTAFENPVKGENAKKFKDRLSLPSNVDCLCVPRVNEPIFIKLSTTAKNKDRAIQDSQVTFMKVVAALVRVTDLLTEHENEGEWVRKSIQFSADAITLTAALQEDWLKARREDIKPSLPDDFKRLATVAVPLTAKNLFGDDLEGSIKSVENTNKLAKKMEPTKKTNYAQGNQKKQVYKKKKHFYNNKNNNKGGNNNNNNNNKGGNDYKNNKKDFQKRGSKY